MDTVWLIAADAFFCLFFPLRLCINRRNERRLDVQTGKKEKQSLFIFHTEIKLSDWLDKTFSGLFFSSSFFLFLATAHQKTNKKKKIHHTRRAGRGVQRREPCCSDKEKKKKICLDQKNKTNFKNKITEVSGLCRSISCVTLLSDISFKFVLLPLLVTYCLCA